MSIARRRRDKRGSRLPGRYIVLGLMAGLMVLAGCLMAPRATRDGSVPSVRVRLLAKADRVDLIVDGNAASIAASRVRAVQTFGSKTGQPITVAGKRFHGQVRLVPIVPGETFDVINVVTIDEYLEGVVPSESFPKWPLEALKAQAVTSRTYALYQLQTNNDGDANYDVYADIRSQAYKGVDAETESTNLAVQQTRGVVLTSGPKGREKIFCAYFSSTCGGTTASGDDVFDDANPALRPHSNDGCTDAPRYRWTDFSIRKDELTRRLRVWGTRQQMSIAGMAKLASVEVDERNALGRPSHFAVTDVSGKRFNLKAEQMRNAANADGPKDVQFLSSFFTPVEAGDSIRITDGRGWGHGVGMCQYCTFGWSRRGWNAKQILAASYPGSVLVKAY